MRKLWLVVLAMAPALMPGCGCSSAHPCVPDPNSSGACPPLAGTWTLRFDPETDSSGCMGQTATDTELHPATITFTQMGSDLRASVNNAALVGQVTDDDQFTLNGNTGTDIDDGGSLVGHEIDFNIRGKFIPDATGDGGTINDGTWETTNVDVDCDRQTSFTATR